MNILKIIIAIVLLIGGVLLLYPFENMVVDAPVEILNCNKVVHPGEMLKYKFSYHKRFAIPGELQKFIVEIKTGDTVILSSFVGNLSSGKHTIVSEVMIPCDILISGKAYLLFKYRYEYLGGIKDTVSTYKSEIFEIKRKF